MIPKKGIENDPMTRWLLAMFVKGGGKSQRPFSLAKEERKKREIAQVALEPNGKMP